MSKLFFYIRSWLFALCAGTTFFVVVSCQVPPPARPVLIDTSFPVMGAGRVDSRGLVSFFMENNSDADEDRILRLAEYYREEAAIESVNSDVAFAQMCLETGFLRFGGLVTEDMNNFCGLGSIGPGQPGLTFPTERIGVRAHIQHLQAYGSTQPLVQELVDSRYRYVLPRGKAPFIGALGGTWAADRQYGEKIATLLSKLYRQ